MIHAVIMAGGRGERFWPESRQRYPKQFLNLLGSESMIQTTVKRIRKLVLIDNIYVVTNSQYKELVEEHLPDIRGENIIIEPAGRNTAACIGLASAFISKKDPDGRMVILPSDHIIKDEESFIDTIMQGIKKAGEGRNLVTLGIKPNYPETGYGYIKCGEEGEDSIYRVDRFVEKPDSKRARQYLKEGTYLWNTGMFIWKVDAIMESFREYMPELYSSIENMSGAIGHESQESVIRQEYIKLESVSIDYGIMEKAENIYVIQCDFGWDDVGSWTSLERLSPGDDDGNIIRGKVINFDTHRCIFKGEKKLIAAMGVKDLIVVDTDDAILICDKDRAQDIKKLIDRIKINRMDNYL